MNSYFVSKLVNILDSGYNILTAKGAKALRKDRKKLKDNVLTLPS
jgi:hypothetical protein